MSTTTVNPDTEDSSVDALQQHHLHQNHLKRAFELARRGLYTASPNPRVGCVIVAEGKIVGEGWHQRTGEPHAEIHALKQAGSAAPGATAYVTLEPCNHQGRTGPCTEQLKAAGIKRVVIGSADPNPEATGGAQALRQAGLQVLDNAAPKRARELNPGFHQRAEQGRPWVRLKLAMSLDGRTALANGDSRWITGPVARADVHHWRARSDAIVTGSGTVLTDNPRLTARLDDAATRVEQPLRVVMDRRRRVSFDADLFGQPGTTLIWPESPDQGDPASLKSLLRELARREINEVLFECGPTLAGALLEQQLADEWLLYIAPCVLGSDARPLLDIGGLSAMDQRWQMTLAETRRLGNDVRLSLRPQSDNKQRNF